MFESLRPFIVNTGSVIGGVYVVRGYMRERLEDVREKMEEERRATETLRARFTQTHDDVAYTILALLPTLSTQVLEEMDVDGLTRELQTRSRAKATITPAAPRPPSSLTSSIVEVPPYPPAPYPPVSASHNDPEADTRSDIDSVAGSHTSEVYAPSAYHTALSASFVSDSNSVTRSWVIDSGSEAAERSRSPAVSAVSGGISETSGDERLSESIISTATNTTTNSESGSSDTRTKAELWNELKMLTFTRTLTTLYASTLLSLLTTLQLTLLARGKYVNSIIQAEKQERLEDKMRERMERELSPSNLLIKGVTSLVGGILRRSESSTQDSFESLLSGLGLDADENDDDAEDAAQGGDNAERGVWLREIDDDLENKYLTMSWWLLHVGWKDVGERVRRAVEEVFNGVSLKTRLSAIDLHRLIADVRRRVEHEVTFEGTEKKTNFLSSLLPPTPETIYHVLTQGGYTSASTSRSNIRPHLTLTDYDEPVATAASTTSITSSQISHAFENSPALAVSAPTHAHQTPAAGPSYHHPLPVPQYGGLIDAPFLSLLDETRSILTSPDFALVLELSLDRATEVLFEGLERNVFLPEGGTEDRIRLANLLPGLARWSQLALEGLPNELVDKILDQREVGCLSAIAFARFEERFQS